MAYVIWELAENTLLKTACHFLLLLVGFDTLTYRKDYDRSPTLVGYHALSCVGGTCYFCLIVNHVNPLRVMETDVSSPAFDVIYGMLRCKFELFIISAGLV